MTDKEFTLDELKQYDGQNGNKAYVAIDGVVYDMTNVGPWEGGNHHGNTAGNDLSEVIPNAPHKKSVLPKLPVVGKLIK
ncbi:cytochrome B5 [Companilactobacillus allii]|uniref:Cytochrome B5 n=1 Tax=Companilactobacillus allii TaxID=1847728 RepID=A0A1P8Q1N7_9LACO|nr:cytochrome b5 domain-containing protein [Companilactobacillus allii]APX71741.1 cytochrome B5 [Companilactobacillus allii]USQ68828.1 cytochrome B5 [Companilactobacillus allii]